MPSTNNLSLYFRHVRWLFTILSRHPHSLLNVVAEANTVKRRLSVWLIKRSRQKTWRIKTEVMTKLKRQLAQKLPWIRLHLHQATDRTGTLAALVINRGVYFWYVLVRMFKLIKDSSQLPYYRDVGYVLGVTVRLEHDDQYTWRCLHSSHFR